MDSGSIRHENSEEMWPFCHNLRLHVCYAPMKPVTLGLMMPLGRRWKSYSTESTTTVCPALLPPCRDESGTQMSARSRTSNRHPRQLPPARLALRHSLFVGSKLRSRRGIPLNTFRVRGTTSSQDSGLLTTSCHCPDLRLGVESGHLQTDLLWGAPVFTVRSGKHPSASLDSSWGAARTLNLPWPHGLFLAFSVPQRWGGETRGGLTGVFLNHLQSIPSPPTNTSGAGGDLHRQRSTTSLPQKKVTNQRQTHPQAAGYVCEITIKEENG